MHQGEATTSQLGWHPDELPSYTANLKILLKKGEKIQEGGLGQNPRRKYRKAKKKKTEKKSNINNKNNRLRKSKPRHST